jgi:imidazolonepropionase-like amidohydrolase
VTVAIRAARTLDVEAGILRADQVVLVDGERITDVRDAALPLPDETRVVDLPGQVLLPGLIDLHTHLVGEIEGGDYTAILARSEADEALSGVANATATLHAGFTTVRDVGTFRAFVDVALRRAIEAGHLAGPRMMCAGAYVTCPGGGGACRADVVPPDAARRRQNTPMRSAAPSVSWSTAGAIRSE